MKIILLDKIDKKILLLDSLGALVTAINLMVIPQFESYTGIPRDIALILLPLPILYSIFSFLSYKFGNHNWRSLLKMIAIANLFYCCLTMYVTWINFDTFKILGIIYFIVEILIIVVLATLELKIALNHNELKNE
jgi:hypothetical protein